MRPLVVNLPDLSGYARSLSLLSRGLGTTAIARNLVVSEKTVATHVQRILLKPGMPTRARPPSCRHTEGLGNRDVTANAFAEDAAFVMPQSQRSS